MGAGTSTSMRARQWFVLLGACAITAGAQETNAPLSLDRAIEMALACNPEALEVQWRVEERAAQADLARADRWPDLTARAGYDYYTEDQRLSQATSAGEAVFGAEILSADLGVSIPIYTGGRLTGSVKAAGLLREAEAGRLARTREEVVFNVTSLFYGMLAQREVIRSLGSALRAMEEQSRAIGEQVAAEKAARVDLLRAEVRMAALRESLTRERNTLTAQRRALAAVLGWEHASPPDIAGELPPPETVRLPDATNCMGAAFAARSDYIAARQRVTAQQHTLAATRARYRPTVSLVGSYGERWMPDPSEPETGADEEYGVGRVGLAVEWPLFEGGATSARVREQTARLGAAREQVRALELRIRYEIETALGDFESAHERVAATEKAVEQARETFRIIKEKYDLGKGTMTDVLDAQAALVQTETSAARALADLVLAKARCQLATGELER